MVNYNFRIWKLATYCLLLGLPASGFASGTVYEAEKKVEVLGAEMGAKAQTVITPAEQVASAVSVSTLGTALQALFALTNPPNTIDGVTYTEVYSFGKRIFADSRYL